MANAEKIERFVAEVDWSVYDGADYRYVAWRSADALTVLACRVTAVSQHSGTPPESIYGEELVIGQGHLRDGDLQALLLSLPHGRARFGTLDLELRGRDSPEFAWWRNSGPEGCRKRLGWPGEELLGSGADQDQIVGSERFENLERDLLRLTSGRFATLAAIGEFLGQDATPLSVSRRQNSVCELYAPTYLRLHEPEIDHQHLQLKITLECRFRTLPPDLAVYVQAPGAQAPHPVTLGPWDPSLDTMRTIEHTLPATPGPCELHLYAFGRTIETRRAGLPSLRALAHAQIDGGDRWFNSMLGDGRKPTGDAFAHAVATLLQLTGTPAVYYGYNRKMIDHAPDLVAELAPGVLMVAECKSAAPAPEDVGTLTARTAEIVDPLGGPWKFDVYKILFTGVPTSAVSAETLRAAHNQDVKVVGRERLIELRAAIGRGETLSRSFRSLLDIRGPG